MSTNTLEKGIIYFGNNILPVHSSDDEWQQGAMVIPDGINWYKAKANDDEWFAFSSKSRLLEVTDEHGDKILVHNRYGKFIRAYKDSWDDVYFSSEDAAKRMGYKFSISLEAYAMPDHPHFFGDRKVFSYQDSSAASKLRKFKEHIPQYVNDNDEWKFGVEIEKCDRNELNGIECERILQETGFKKEEDGSLNSGGFELITPILPLMDNKRIDKAFTSEPYLIKMIDATADGSCGGHITISRKDYDNHKLLEGFKGFAPVLYAMYEGRLSNRYCTVQQWKNYFTINDRYVAFNLKNSGRLEIRLFSRVSNYRLLKWRIGLMQLFVQDYGRNLNQFLLKMSSKESKLYKHLSEQYTHEKIAEKIKKAALYSERYGCGKVSASIKARINQRFGFDVFA